MKHLKQIRSWLILFSFSTHVHTSVDHTAFVAQVKEQVAQEAKKTLTTFKPDIHITEELPQDHKLLEKIKQLFFEADLTANPKKDVYQKAVREFGGQEIILLTDDNVRISALYFKRTNAPLNLIYIPGYFFDQTPTKEWGAPFSL